MGPHKDLYVHSSLINNSPKLETIQTHISRKMDKGVVEYSYNVLLFSNDYNMNEMPKEHVE